MRDFDELALEFLWSLWTELGAPGPRRSHRHVVVDLERLLLATPWLARDDARLLDLAFAWCVQHRRWVSGQRLTTLLNAAPGRVRDAATPFFGELASAGVTVARVAPCEPARDRDARTIRMDLGRSALLQLRVRALVGVSGRADVLLGLLAVSESWPNVEGLWLDASALVEEVALAKRNVARILAELAEGGIVHERRRGNRHEFRLASPDALKQVVGQSTSVFPNWGRVFHWLHLVGTLLDLDDRKPASFQVEVARARGALTDLALALDLHPPTASLEPLEFLAWARDHTPAVLGANKGGERVS